MSGSSDKLGRKKEAAVLTPLSTRTVEEAVRVARLNPRTLYRWLREADFAAACREAKRAAFGQAVARLHHLSSAAVSTLGKVMLDAGTPPSTRVRAADSILNHTIKAIEIEEISARLAALERGLEARKNAGDLGRKSPFPSEEA